MSSKSPVYIGKGSRELAYAEALTIIANSPVIANHKVTAGDYAQKADGTTVVDANTSVNTNLYSAYEYAQGANINTGGSARDYAQKTDGGVSGNTTHHSSKAWAVGGTGVTSTESKGSSKDWAIGAGGTMDSKPDNSEYSAKEYAIGVTAPLGSAKRWASHIEDSAVAGGLYSALHYAAKAEDAKDAAETAQTAAETAKTAVDNTFDNFDDRFLGTFTTANEPSEDNDGDALSTGAVYYNSTEGEVRFYNGSTWESPASSATTSATNAATSATAAQTAQTAAETAQSAAETAETNAETAETNAETAQTAAETAQTAAETALDSVDDRYLGAKDTSSGEPTTDNDSNTLLDGALYFDATNNQMKVYDLGNSTWLKMHVTATEASNISVLVEKYDGSTTSTSGDNRNITQVDTVADAIANVNKVAVKEAEVGRLGAAAYSEGVSAYLAVLGTSAMSDPSTGYIKKVADIDSNVTTVAGIDGNVTTVAGVSANVTTVATNIADVNNFADLYQINDFTSTPTEDGGGNAVAEGDLAYDSTANKLKYYDGSGWQDSTGVSLATVQTEPNNASVDMSIALG